MIFIYNKIIQQILVIYLNYNTKKQKTTVYIDINIYYLFFSQKKALVFTELIFILRFTDIYSKSI